MAFDWFRRTFFKRSEQTPEQSGEQSTSVEATPAGEEASLDRELDDDALQTTDREPEPDLDAESGTPAADESPIQPAELPGERSTEAAEAQPMASSAPEASLAFAQETYANIQRQVLHSSSEDQDYPAIATEPLSDAAPVSAEDASLEAQIEVVSPPPAEPELTPPIPRVDSPRVDSPLPVDTPSEPVGTPTTDTQTDVAELPSFDEGFVWSAEVLARQGRKAEEISVEEINWLQKLRKGLTKTRLNVVNQLKAIVGQGPLNQDAVEEIEAILLQSDVGVQATDYIIEQLQHKLRTETLPPDAAIAYLKQLLCDMLDQTQGENFMPRKGVLNIWLMTGVNGAGKTTTIGKIAHVAQKSGYHCVIAAADTFRAAAVEQVKVWGQRSNVDVICNPGKNTDPAAVVFDGIQAAQSRGADLLLVDTAGRLQNKKNLMDELSKIRRIVDKKAPDARVESLLVLDATLGQNGLRQAQVFSESAKLTGVVLTKLDGTAKGGVALGVVQQLGLPIRFIGAGEGIEDLRPFSSYEFVEALLSN